MDVLDLMQRALDKTNDPDAIFALDRGITEIERLREALRKIYMLQSTLEMDAMESHDIARAALKEKK